MWKRLLILAIYLASIFDVSVIISDEVVEWYNEEIKTIPMNLNQKKATCKKQTLHCY